jgi:catechol 2,3-dioxygenase-like lactoylglutathione lyase family enzyme
MESLAMFDHLSLGVHDLGRATAFYRRTLEAIGYQLHRSGPDEVAFGPGDVWSFFLYPVAAPEAVTGARMHVAFRADSRAGVRAFYATALAAGATAVPDRAPDQRPQFGADYFGAVLRDPDGHVIEIMTRAD